MRQSVELYLTLLNGVRLMNIDFARQDRELLWATTDQKKKRRIPAMDGHSRKLMKCGPKY